MTGHGLDRQTRFALLALDAAMVLVVLAGWTGPWRIVLALLFASLVPGGALLARRGPQDPVARAAATVAVSWAVTVLVNDLLLELGWWNPDAALLAIGAFAALLLVTAGDPRPAAPAAVTPFDGGALVSVVVCTRDRPEALASALPSIQALRHRNFEVVVVDNAPTSGATAEVVTRLAGRDRRVRYVVEPRPGLSRARNRGVREARGAVVAFTDDDAVVDPSWLDAVATAFGSDGRIGCVTGPVPALDLGGDAQQQFERRVSWSGAAEPVVFDLRTPPAGAPLFPYAAGQFGTGANMAFRRDALETAGPFDEALGAGSRARGGEDLDMFVRVLRAGWAIAYEPAAVVRHAHRDDGEKLRQQLHGYGVGLTAYLTKQLASPRAAFGMLVRLPRGLRHGLSLLGRSGGSCGRPLRWAEARGMAYGPVAYVLGRLEQGWSA
jgi:GT2 family glycosyltransferase